jgi:hypothetical protein
MRRIITFAVSFFLLLFFATSVYADDIPTGAFKGDYYNGTNFDSFVFTRQDAAINFNWWMGSPGAGVNKESFSIRWQGRFDFSAGDWEFRALPDDGIRVFVDGEKIIDSWKIQHGTFFKVVKNLTGSHLIVVEYFEADQWAGIGFNWVKVTPQPVTTPSGGGKITPGVSAPTAPPLYKGLYVSSCEDLTGNPLKGDAPLEVAFSGAGYDPFGVIRTYIFDFGDESDDARLTQEDSYASHIYKKPGKYIAKLTIKDSKGNLRTSDVCKVNIEIGGYYNEGYAEPTVYPATASTLPKTGIFDNALLLILFTVPMAIFGILLNRKFSKL